MLPARISRRASMSLSHLLNPVAQSNNRPEKQDEQNNTSEVTQPNAPRRQAFRMPRIVARLQNKQLHVGQSVDFTAFEIPTVPVQVRSERPHLPEDHSRYPLLAAYISSKLVSHVQLQCASPTSETRCMIIRKTHKRIYHALCDLECSTQVVLAALLYLLQIFPEGIPYSGTRSRHCVDMLTRLFLLGFQLSIVWFHDNYADLNTWTSITGLSSVDVVLLEQDALDVLGYTLFIAPAAWNEFLELISHDCASFLNPGDVENLRGVVLSLRAPAQINPHTPFTLTPVPQLDFSQDSAVVAHSVPGSPERTIFTSGMIDAKLDRLRLRIAERALHGKISLVPVPKRIEPGTEEDFMFDALDQEEELLFEELLEAEELNPPLSVSPPPSPFQPPSSIDSDSYSSTSSPSFLSHTRKNVEGVYPKTFTPPSSRTPLPSLQPSQPITDPPPCSPHPPPRSISPVIKIEEVELELLWPSSPDNGNFPVAEGQERQEIARRKPLGDLDPLSFSTEPQSSSVSNFSSRNVSLELMRISLDVHAENPPSGKPSKHYEDTAIITHASLEQGLSEAPRAVLASRNSQAQNLTPKTPATRIGSILNSSLSPLSPLPSMYDSDFEAKDDADKAHSEYSGNVNMSVCRCEGKKEEEEVDSSDGSELWDSDSESSESAYDPSGSPPPFRIPDTYNKETGLWVIPPGVPSGSDTEEDGEPGTKNFLPEDPEPFDAVAYFVSMACFVEVDVQSYLDSPFGPLRWEVDPLSLRQEGSIDENLHPLDVEAELIHREFLSISRFQNPTPIPESFKLTG
ncbi:hypothetical protein J3R30DRAFT_137272 [Lentinula aciculospora]|uniref:Uncharacterized protein n=1 Tax=Lentinula aciculospora TaxID=153920 RepID=A0A9W9AWF1_9AGAR|nr:hypothetical protein J3R30DRAFT_137272 [Lentinula aciculospora]